MNNLSQPPQPAETDMALLCLGSLFEALHHTPEREVATLDALAELILEERPRTLFGLVIASRAEKWLRRHLWMVDFGSPSPSDQAARIVIDSALRLDCARPNKIEIFGPKSDGSYWLELRQADRQSLVVSVPASETAVLKYFQARMPYGLVLPDDQS